MLISVRVGSAMWKPKGAPVGDFTDGVLEEILLTLVAFEDNFEVWEGRSWPSGTSEVWNLGDCILEVLPELVLDVVLSWPELLPTAGGCVSGISLATPTEALSLLYRPDRPPCKSAAIPLPSSFDAADGGSVYSLKTVSTCDCDAALCIVFKA
jgi:hypothetical protein